MKQLTERSNKGGIIRYPQATGPGQSAVKLPKKNAEVSEKDERNIVGATSPRILPSC